MAETARQFRGREKARCRRNVWSGRLFRERERLAAGFDKSTMMRLLTQPELSFSEPRDGSPNIFQVGALHAVLALERQAPTNQQSCLVHVFNSLFLLGTPREHLTDCRSKAQQKSFREKKRERNLCTKAELATLHLSSTDCWILKPQPSTDPCGFVAGQWRRVSTSCEHGRRGRRRSMPTRS